MYGAIGTQTNSNQESVKPRPPLHALTAELGQRICTATARLDKTLGRLRGSQPVATGSLEKQEREISTNEFIQACHVAMARMEEQLSELENVIG